MMKRVIIALCTSLISGAFAAADEPARTQSWSLGGAALSITDSARITLWSEKGLSAGVASDTADIAGPVFGAASTPSGGMQSGGFLAWQSSIYRIDATLSPGLDGQMALGLNATLRDDSTRYGLRVGTAWTSAEHFTVNPASSLGLAELSEPNNNYNVSFMISHALTPNLSIIGMAEAQRSFGLSPLDSNSSNNGLARMMIGAGLGYKF